MTKRNVAILLFNNVEVLDFAGPFEVFSVTSELNNHELFHVYTVAEKPGAVTAVNGLSVNPRYCFADCPRADIVIIPGGIGSRVVMSNLRVIEWVRTSSQHAELVLSICSGARVLAKSGLLDGLEATTHHEVIEHLRELAPHTVVRENVRFIDTGRIMTSGGISAGIDLSFYVVHKLLGEEVAAKTARYMEYNWKDVL